MTRAGSRRAEPNRSKFAVSFLAGIVVGAVMAVATIVLLESQSVVLQAAAIVPLTAAVVVTGIVLWRHGGPGPAEEMASAPAVEREVWDAATSDVERTNAEAAAQAQGADRARDAAGHRSTRVSTITNGMPTDGSHPNGAEVAQPEAAAASGAGEPDTQRRDARAVDLPLDEAGKADGTPDESPQVDISRALIEAWERYRRAGDGFFTVRGLQRQVDALDVDASVSDGSAVGAHGDLLLLTIRNDGGDCDGDRFFVVPSFARSPRAAPDWFEDASSGALSTTTTTIHRVAEGKWTGTSFTVVERGRIG